TGKVKKLSEVADEVFSEEVLGKGFAVVPSNGQIVSPITGTVTAVFPTKHAIGITSDKGLEVLVHIGIDTVTLEGKGFTSNIKMGDKIYQGTPIVEVDLALIEAAGLATDTIVVVTNSAEYANFALLEKDEVSEGEVILDVEK
ncbi:MAG: PTS glucose transporter subunit IIA, partial [Lactococcus sp.]|nr:PTS glucose transporter subunit IIA [Lactococcus sp.]